MKKILLIALTTLAFAQTASAIDWFVGASAGNSAFESTGSLSDLTEYDDADTSFTLTWGMPIEEFFNFEITYSDFGSIDYAERQIGTNTLVSFSQNPSSLAASAVFNYSINDDFALFGRAGYEKWEVDYENNGGLTLPQSSKTSGYAPYYGIGIDYKVSDRIRATGEVQHHDFDLGDNQLTFQNYQVGLRYFY